MDLWVLPPSSESKWFARLDWYLNWQMSKGLAFEPTAPSVELIRVIKETEATFEASPALKSAPLLVASRGRLPSSKCLVLPLRNSLREWLSEVHSVAHKMNALRLRLFLPRGAESAEAQVLWSQMEPVLAEVQFTADEDAL